MALRDFLRGSLEQKEEQALWVIERARRIDFAKLAARSCDD